MVPNKVSASVNPEEMAEIINLIKQLKSKLPFLIDLSIEERKSLPKLGDKSLMFVTKALELVQQDSGFLPRDFDIEEMKKDLELFNTLQSIRLEMGKLYEMIEDTYIEAGSEAYSAALVVYNAAKRYGKSTVGMDGALDELSRRFFKKQPTTTSENK